MSTSVTAAPIPLPEFTARVLALYRPPLRRRATCQAMRRVLGNLARVPGVESTSDLTTEAMASYAALRSSEVCRNTIIGEYGYLKAATSFAAEEGLVGHPPNWRRLRLRKGARARAAHHPLADVARLLAALGAMAPGSWRDHRLYALASTVAYTGLRRTEALSLRAEDVRPSDGFLDVVARGEDGLKTEGSEQPVPIPAPLAPVLAAWLPACGSEWLFPGVRRRGPWTGGMAGTKALDRLKAAGEAIGVPGVTWQSLRHSWATHAESAWGLSDGVIQRVLRHTTPLTQRHYRHADLANLSAAVATVSYSG